MPRRSSSNSGGGNRSSSTRLASTTTRQPIQTPVISKQQSNNTPTVHQPSSTSSGPGLFGQMASTAAGVAVGHTMGQGLSSMLFGSGSKEQVNIPTSPEQQNNFIESNSVGGQCETNAKDFTRCLESTNNDINSCSYYLEQLKACQNMFSQAR